MQTDFIKSSAPEAWDLQGTGSAAGAGGGSSSAGSAVNTQDTSQNFAGFTDIGSGFEGGNVLFRNSGYLRLGQGDNSVIFDANDALYRVAVGSETYATAPFRVQKDGKFHAGSSSQYIDWDGTKLTIAGDVVQIDTSTGAVKGSLQNVISLTAGETISGATTPVPVYLASDGKVYKADADSTTPEARNVLGFCITDTTINNSATIQTDGILTVPTITLSETISSTLDQETYFTSGSTNIAITNTPIMYSQVFRTGGNVGNVSSIVIYEDWTGTMTSVVDIFAIDADGKPTGTTLGTSQGVTHGGASNGQKTYTFSTPVTVSPNTNYAMRISLSSYTSGTLYPQDAVLGKYTVLSAPTAMSYTSSNSGSTWTSSAYTLCFKTYTTNFTAQKGDGIFLSTTAGTYTNIQPTTIDCSHQKIGEIISTTQIKIGIGKSVLLKKISPTLPTVVTTPKVFCYAPKNSMKCELYGDLGIGTGAVHNYIKESLIKNEVNDVYITTPISTTNTNIRLRWEGGVIILERDAMSSAALTSLDLYFYS